MVLLNVFECFVELEDSEASDAATRRTSVTARVVSYGIILDRRDSNSSIIAGDTAGITVVIAGIVDEGEAKERQGQDDEEEADIEGNGVSELATEGLIASIAGVRRGSNHDVAE